MWDPQMGSSGREEGPAGRLEQENWLRTERLRCPKDWAPLAPLSWPGRGCAHLSGKGDLTTPCSCRLPLLPSPAKLAMEPPGLPLSFGPPKHPLLPSELWGSPARKLAPMWPCTEGAAGSSEDPVGRGCMCPPALGQGPGPLGGRLSLAWHRRNP